MDWLISIVTATPEYQHIGWNLVFGSFLVTVMLTFGLQLPGLINQAKVVWKKRSAEGIETLTFITFFTYFAVFLVYAFSIRSGAGIVNALVLLPPQLFIMMGIIRFKKLRAIDKIVALAGFALFAVATFLPRKELFFLVATIASLLGLFLQPLEMIRTKRSDNIALLFPLNFSFTSFVWTVYGFSIGDFFLAGAAGMFGATHLFIMVLWFKYRS